MSDLSFEERQVFIKAKYNGRITQQEIDVINPDGTKVIWTGFTVKELFDASGESKQYNLASKEEYDAQIVEEYRVIKFQRELEKTFGIKFWGPGAYQKQPAEYEAFRAAFPTQESIIAESKK